MHNNRDQIKWAPFNSVINGQKVVKEIMAENNSYEKPILSEEQLAKIEKDIIECYENECPVEIIYYKRKHFYKETGIITKIDATSKKIILNHKSSYYFNNIMTVKAKNT